MSFLLSVGFTPARAQTNVSPAEARAIAKEAYIYGFPVVDSYRILYGYFVDRDNPDFKAPWNQTPNSDMVDLRLLLTCAVLVGSASMGLKVGGYNDRPDSPKLWPSSLSFRQPEY